uniref:Heparinase n=1 Tax=Parastrongyloides trichosuri TaxID=131310 RepID=A0A0N4ZDF8_PARTI
ISYELKHNSSSDVIMVKCPGSNFKYETLSGNFIYDNNLKDKGGFKEFDDKKYAWMAWKKEDMSVSNLNIQCGSYDYNVAGTVDFKKLFWNIKLISTNTTKFLESVNLLSILEATGNPMKSTTKCGKTNDKLKIISKDRNGTLSIVERIQFNVLQSKKIFYFFDESKIEKKTEFLTPCGIADVHHTAPTILIDGHKLVEIAGTDGIKEKLLVKGGENKFSLKLEDQAFQEMKDFYQGEKVLIKKMLYRNGKAKIKEENGIETSESFIVTGYEILEISYKSLTANRNYKDVKEVVFFGPDNKDLELEDNLFNISK